MALETAKYHYGRCDGQTGNLVDPTCKATSTGVFAETDTELRTALTSTGWVLGPRGKLLCPVHKDQAK